MKILKYRRPRGTQDLLPDYLEKWNYVADVWRKVVKKYNFREIVTPMFENTELFNRTAGETSDIVTKEMYTFCDRGGRSITLRPEGTAAVVRAYFENNLNNGYQPVKLFYLMPMFRYERPQMGRFRQHHQYGVECIGVRSPYIDVEIMSLFMDFYKTLNIVEPVIWLNSLGCEKCRPQYKEKLVNYLNDSKECLCEECQIRLEKNPLRILDCKNEVCRKYIDKAPLILDNLCSECQKDFETVKELLEEQKINYIILPMLVRGLDYYNRTVFEIAAKGVSAKEVIAGGGRYDILLKEIGGLDSSAFGAGAGMERLISTLEMQGVNIPIIKSRKVAVIAVEEVAKNYAFSITQKIRHLDFQTELILEAKKIGKLLATLEGIGFDFAVMVGENEMHSKKVTIKRISSREQRMVFMDEIEKVIGML